MNRPTTQRFEPAKMLSVSVFVLALTLLAVRAADADQQKLAAANSDFSFRLLKELVREHPAKNVFISPYSTATCLQIACNGAGGQTKAEMMKVLGLAGLQQSSINAGASEIAASLNAADTNVVLTTANAIWCRKDVPGGCGIYRAWRAAVNIRADHYGSST